MTRTIALDIQGDTYVARPGVRVQAMQFTRQTWPQVNDWLRAELGPGKFAIRISGRKIMLSIDTLEGRRDCPAGYYVVRGTAGEFYPVRPDIFEAKYDVDGPLADVVPIGGAK